MRATQSDASLDDFGEPSAFREEVDRANATGLTPVLFIHGMWLLPTSWNRWAEVFEAAGYTALNGGVARRPRDRR